MKYLSCKSFHFSIYAEKSKVYDKRVISAVFFFMMVQYFTKRTIISRNLIVKNDEVEFKSNVNYQIKFKSNIVTYIQNIDLE